MPTLEERALRLEKSRQDPGRKEWNEKFWNNLGDRENLRIPKSGTIIEKVVAIPIALASIYGKDLIDWITLPGDVMQGKRNPTPEEMTTWAMGAMGGSAAGVSEGGLRSGLTARWQKMKMREGKAVARSLDPKELADELNLTYQGTTTHESIGLTVHEFMDNLTKGNIGVKTLDELEDRVFKLREAFAGEKK